jgi:peptide deformylase
VPALELGDEGCLSLPGVHVEVERHAQLRVRARDRAGEEIEVEAEGLEARVIQHEIDHLNGVLILDHISRQARKEAMRAMREAQEAAADRSADAA